MKQENAQIDKKSLTCNNCFGPRDSGHKLCHKCLQIDFHKKYLARRSKRPKIKCLSCGTETIKYKPTQKFCKLCYVTALKAFPFYIDYILKEEKKKTTPIKPIVKPLIKQPINPAPVNDFEPDDF